MVCPETDSAVQIIPAMAITKNIPDAPDSPNRSSTTDEMMIVSMVIPDTGLRAVVAMALAATEAKKNEKTSVSATPAATTAHELESCAKKTATPSVLSTTPSRMAITEMSRSVRSRLPSPCRKALMAMPNDPATTRSDFTMPNIPAVAMAPTPMNRT